MSGWDKVTVPWSGDMTDEDYFALDAWDQSQLKQWMISPAQWEASKSVEQTPAMRFGTAAHALVLGSGAPVKAMGHTPRSKAGKEEAEQALKDHVTLLPEADFDAVSKMAEITHPVFQRIGGHAEQAMIVKDPDTGLTLKGKADWLPLLPDNSGMYFIYDYKTTSAPLDDFPRTALNGGYDIQAAFYMKLWRLTHGGGDGQKLGFRFIVQEKKPPFDFEQWEMFDDDDEIVQAGKLIDATLTDIVNYREQFGDKTPTPETAGRDHEPQQIVFSDWMMSIRQKTINNLKGKSNG